MSSLWTPYGEDPVPPGGTAPPAGGPGGPPGGPGPGGPGPDGPEGEPNEEQMREMLSRLAATPVEGIVTQFAVELQEIAVLHLGLSSERPESLGQAALAIDAMAALVDGLGDRLAPNHEPLRQAVAAAAARLRRGHERFARRGWHYRVSAGVSQRIEDYALIGDTQTAALVGKDGSIDWLCTPRFDSGAVFAALLGTREHGRWQIAPAGGLQRVERRYLDDTLVLETTFLTDDGVVKVTDCMPIRNRTVDIVRVVEGISGRVPDAHGPRHPVRLRQHRAVGPPQR